MAIVLTQLTLSPTFVNKVMTSEGSIAVNEKVLVTVENVNDVTDEENPVLPEGLVLRITSPCGRAEYARFPSETGDVWVADGANATCTLAMNTKLLQGFFFGRSMQDVCEAIAVLESGSTDNLYASCRLLIRNWVQNPVDPVAGSLQMQGQIDTLTTRLEEHQHNDETEGESSFPHNNLSGRSDTGCHPVIEAGVANAALVASNAQSTADTASSNASTALSTAQGAVVLANDAQSTADSAVTKADTAQNTADGAQEDATTALAYGTRIDALESECDGILTNTDFAGVSPVGGVYNLGALQEKIDELITILKG